MKLPGTELWSPELLTQRIAFERSVAHGARAILEETVDVGEAAVFDIDSSPFSSDAIFALGRAAELAFADERLILGHQICRELLAHELARPRTRLQFSFYATVGALLGEFEVFLTPQGAMVLRNGEAVGRISWPQNSSVEAVRLIQLLLPAAAASGPVRKTVGPLLIGAEKEGLSPSVLAAVAASAEFQVVASFGRQETENSDEQTEFQVEIDSPKEGYLRALGSLKILEAEYTLRVYKLQSDAYYWKALRPRGSIIDWPLLSLWVAAYKFEAMVPDDGAPLTAEAAFIRSLAKAIQSPMFMKQSF